MRALGAQSGLCRARAVAAIPARLSLRLRSKSAAGLAHRAGGDAWRVSERRPCALRMAQARHVHGAQPRGVFRQREAEARASIEIPGCVRQRAARTTIHRADRHPARFRRRQSRSPAAGDGDRLLGRRIAGGAALLLQGFARFRQLSGSCARDLPAAPSIAIQRRSIDPAAFPAVSREGANETIATLSMPAISPTSSSTSCSRAFSST